MAGQAADTDPFSEIAEKRGLWLIEDTAQASGAAYKSRFVGTIGNVGTFSTVDVKTMSTGEGGFCLTDDDHLALRIDTGALGVTREQFEKALNAEGIPVSPAWSTTFLPKTQLFKKRIGYGSTDCPWRFSLIDYTNRRFPPAESADREASWLTDAFPVLTEKDLNDIIAAVEKVASTFLAHANVSPSLA